MQQILQTHLRPWSTEQILIFLLFVIVGNLWLSFALRTGRIRRRQITSIILLEFYMALVYSSTVFTRQSMGSHLQLELFAGWKAVFLEHSAEAMTEGVLNIVLFLPIGWLLVTACRRACRIPQLILYGAAFSLFIEVSQFVFRCGFSSVDDLLNNTVGCILGIAAKRLVQGIMDET